jgi:tetratricopeptide (TPR) repeat protein
MNELPADSVSPLSNRAWAISLALVVLTYLTFIPVLHCAYTDFDDPEYVSANKPVLNGLTTTDLRWAWTTTHAGYWQPLSWVSLMIDATIGGADPHVYHRTNLLLHAFSAGVVFLVLSRLTGTIWRAALVAALYAVHPLRVESVAWVAERKDVLSNLFAWLTIGGYVAYTRAPNSKRYLLVLIPFVLGLLSKPMIATLPCLLLLLDYWPLRRITLFSPLPVLRGPALSLPKARVRVGVETPSTNERSSNALGTPSPALPLSTGRGRSLGQLILEKLPLFLLAFVAGSAAMASQRKCGALMSLKIFPLAERIPTIIQGYGLYLLKMVWYPNLILFYPIDLTWPWTRIVGIILSAIALLAISVLSIANYRRRPWLLVGWLWFIGVLLPVSGVFQAGPQALADRFSYLPSVGLLIMIVWSIPTPPVLTITSLRLRGGLAGVAIASLCTATWIQCGYWQNTRTAFTHALAVSDNNWLAHDQICLVLYREGNMPGAIAECAKALRLNPTDAVGNYNMGLALARQGNDREAIKHFLITLSVEPNQYQAYASLGASLQRIGQLSPAFDQFHHALALQPDYYVAHSDLGGLLAQVGLLDDAIAEFHEALRLNPKDDQAQKKLEYALVELKQRNKKTTSVAATGNK